MNNYKVIIRKIGKALVKNEVANILLTGINLLNSGV